jgi:hypothetical protein
MYLFFVLYNTAGGLTSDKFMAMVIGCLMSVHAIPSGAVRMSRLQRRKVNNVLEWMWKEAVDDQLKRMSGAKM